jgi:hypothetical protein
MLFDLILVVAIFPLHQIIPFRDPRPSNPALQRKGARLKSAAAAERTRVPARTNLLFGDATGILTNIGAAEDSYPHAVRIV